MRAIKDYQGPLKEHEVTIFVRRGGPNYQEGLRVMGEVGKCRLEVLSVLTWAVLFSSTVERLARLTVEYTHQIVY